MTDVGLGLVTSLTAHTSHTHQTKTQSQNNWQQKSQQQHNQHSLRNNTRRSTSSSPLSTSTSTSTTTTTTTTPTTTKGRITCSAAAAAAKAAEERDKEKKNAGKKMTSTITTTGLTSTAAASSNSSSSRHSSNTTTPTSPVGHHTSTHPHSHYSHQQHPPPHQQQHQHQQQYNTRSHPTSHPTSYTDSSSLAVQHPSTSSPSTTDARHQEQQDRLRGPLTRKRAAATLITTDLSSSQKQRLSIDLGATSGATTTASSARHGHGSSTEAAASSPGSSSRRETTGDNTSPRGGGGATDLDNISVGSGGGSSSLGGQGGGAGSGQGGGYTGGAPLPPQQRDLICLCTPAPKVPRPRNAFILYRQHHQARVVAENPGLANPEISKIIGEKWRAESDLHKEEWKQLAEEEKLHHQRKYPEYKYQPRRGNKNSVAGGIGSNRTSPTTPGGGPGGIGGIGIGGTGAGGTTGTGTEHPGRCPNCGGRYIATPRTPSTPFAVAAAGMGSAKSVTGEAHGRGGHGHGHGQSAFNMSSAGIDTPRGGMEHHASPSSRGQQQQHYGQQQGGGGYRDHRASVSSQGGGYQAYPSRDYHHSQTYPYPTPSHHQQYPAHPLYDMPQEYDVSTPTGTGSKRRRYDSISMPYRPEREYALPSPSTPYGSGSRHPSVGGQYAVRPLSHYHPQNPMSPTPLGHGHSHGHGQVPMHHYPPPPPPTPSGAIGGGGSTGSLPPTPGFAPAPAGPPTSTAALSGPASLAPSGRGRSPLSNTMAPPPRPPTLSVPGSSGSYHHGQQHQGSGPRSGLSPVRMRGDDSVFDPSLRLPPLQTHLAHLPPNSPESGSSSSVVGAGAGILSASGGGIGLGITYPGDPRDPRSASSSSPYPRLTGPGTAGNTSTAGSFPASYHQGAHPHLPPQPSTSVHPSWATLHNHGQREQQQKIPRSEPSPAATAKDNRERSSITTTLPHHRSSQAPDTTTTNTNTKRQLALLEAQQRQQSVEAMVMSIDYARKASVLRRIGRELPAYGAVADIIDNMSEEAGDDSAQEQPQVVTTRGPIIAVEGPNKELLRVVGKAVERALVALGDCEVRAWVGEGDVWDGDGEGGSGEREREKRKKNSGEKEKGQKKGGGEDVEMGECDTVIVAGGSSPKSNNNNNNEKDRSSSSSSSSPPLPSTTTTNKNKNPSFPRYLDLMLSWHHKASELTKFVTTPYFSPSSSSFPSSRSSSPLPPSRHPSYSPSSISSDHQKLLPKLPIALLPLGYSLTYSDRFACTIPIADAYAPVDHWQWMATLWRGVVGPDLTVYVKPVTEDEMMWAHPAPVGVEVVEVKGERLIVVRVVVPPSSGHGHGGGQMEELELLGGEEAEKQLAYEVGEWVRAGPFGVRGRGGVARGERDTTAQVGYEYGRAQGHGYGDGGW